MRTNLTTIVMAARNDLKRLITNLLRNSPRASRRYHFSRQAFVISLLVLNTYAAKASDITDCNQGIFPACLRLAEQGYWQAQNIVGMAYGNGRGVSKDDTKAVYWFRKAAEQGSADAQRNLGISLRYGRGTAKDEVQAVGWFRKAAEQGNAGAQTSLGLAYEKGSGVGKNDELAVQWFQKAAAQGDADAQNHLGIAFRNGHGIRKDDAKAVYWFRLAAEQGDGSAQYNLGLAYAIGEGIPKDETQAASWYQKAAAQGVVLAQYNLGDAYAKGSGIAKDEAQAVFWYRKAAEQGNTEAQNNLGLLLKHGQATEKDAREGLHWLRKAAEQGNASAQANLGIAYMSGKGVTEDQVQAVYWFRKAAEQGHRQAQFNLSVHYRDGDGVEKSPEQAFFWMQKAAEHDNPHFQNDLGEMYAAGYGTKVAPQRARQWFEQAAALVLQGSAECKASTNQQTDSAPDDFRDCNTILRNLALAMELGYGGAEDKTKARKLYETAKNERPGIALATQLWPGWRERREQTSFLVQERFNRGSSLPTVLSRKKDVDACMVEPMKQGSYWPAPRPGRKYDREFDVVVLVETDSDWSEPYINETLQIAADTLADCGIRLRKAQLHHFTSLPSRWCQKTHLGTVFYPATTVIFNKTPYHLSSVGGKANEERQIDIYPDWNKRISPYGKFTLAHELGHSLGDMSHPATFEPTIMQYGYLFSERFPPQQCEQMRQSSALMPLTTAKSDKDIKPARKPVFLENKTTEQIVDYLLPRNKLAALFYEMLRPDMKKGYHDQKEGVDAWRFDVYALKYGLTWSQVSKMYEYVHNWRPETGWVDEKTQFDLTAQANLFWLSGFNKSTAGTLAADLYFRPRREYFDDVRPEVLDPKNAISVGRGDLFPAKLLDYAQSRDVTENYGCGERRHECSKFPYSFRVVGGDFYFVHDYDARVLTVKRNYLNVLWGNDLESVRKHRDYDVQVEDAAKNPHAVISSQAVPTSKLRSQDFSDETPPSIPGGSLITPREAWQAILPGLLGSSPPPLVLTVLPDKLGVPTAYNVDFAASAGSFEDGIQSRLADSLSRLKQSKSQRIIVYCHHQNCWLSYNLALRLINLGYRNVHWMRDGIEGWLDEELPLAFVQQITK